MDITGTSQVYYLSPAYLLIIVVLVGFIYHLIRNQNIKTRFYQAPSLESLLL
ncbi:MAG: hypothetical protein HVN35_03380 [Methanobacteriaceae archaeon]|nr:hypothetical protein [Methanobacteriaceae archaeon]